LAAGFGWKLKERVGAFWGKEESKRWKEKDCSEERLTEAIDERWRSCRKKGEAICFVSAIEGVLQQSGCNLGLSPMRLF